MTRKELEAKVAELNRELGGCYGGEDGYHFAVLANRRLYRHPIALFYSYEAKRTGNVRFLRGIAKAMKKAHEDGTPMYRAIYAEDPLHLYKEAV